MDVWSLGVCGYEMISFKMPFSNESDICNKKIYYEKLPIDNHSNLVPLVYQMLTRDDTSRPSASEMLEKLKVLLQASPKRQAAGSIRYIDIKNKPKWLTVAIFLKWQGRDQGEIGGEDRSRR